MAGLGGRSAFVTGAASGIGRATSLALANRGAFVWVTDFDEVGADRTVEMIEQLGGRARAVRLDVRHEAEWEAALALVDAEGSGLHILVNCAGKSIIAATFTMPIEDLRLILSINVEGTFLGMKHVIPRIGQSGGGAVVNISSVMGLKGAAMAAGYCGSKAAIHMMTKAVALECAALRNNVRVNSVHPGVVDTPAWQKHGADEIGILGDAIAGGAHVLDPHEVAKTMVPIGLACSAGEVAETVAFLVSDDARHMTGSAIVIDGGMSAG
jgi:NAD(P)-dependent dehydrogenase (short-subunit alcohol dehydrogenase family)